MPSLTEALFALGLGDRLVGVTDWCVHPADGVAEIPKVGGTKNPDRDAIVQLAPDLVIANREENTRREVEALERAGLSVWVTYPRTVREGAQLLGDLAGLGAAPEVVAAVVEPVLESVRGAERAPPCEPTPVFCAVWRGPWMAVGPDTYADDLLTLCGGANVFAHRQDRRYPLVEVEEIVAAAPQVVLLPDEPYDFGPREAAELAELAIPAAAAGRIHRIDGTLVSWYGPRIRRAIETLRPLLAG